MLKPEFISKDQVYEWVSPANNGDEALYSIGPPDSVTAQRWREAATHGFVKLVKREIDGQVAHVAVRIGRPV